nr:hypothetical protein [Tanacetum cinerariifolium]
MYLRKAQSEKACLYAILNDQFDPANRIVLDREETLTLERESRSKLNKDFLRPYDYTKLNSLYEIFKPRTQEYHVQLAHENEVRKKIWRKSFVKTKPNIFKNINFLPVSKSISKSRQAYNVMMNNLNHFRELVDQAWVKHSKDHFRAPTDHDMEILIKTYLMPLALKTQNDSFAFVHELKIQKSSVLGKLAPFSDSFERKHFSKTKSVPKNNVSEVLSKPVTTQISPQTARQAIRNTNVIKPGMYRIDTRTTQTRAPQLSQTSRKTNPRVSTSTGVIHKTNVNRPQLRSNKMKDKVAVRFGNDQFAPILSYGDLVQGNITINRVYYVKGLNHNLFSMGQFCDADLEVAFWKSTLSYLNFDYITLLSKSDVVIGLPKLKYVKDQLCSSCKVSKEKRSSFETKTVPCSKGQLNLLHMDLCGQMRVASINGKKYILKASDYDNSGPVPQLQNASPSADTSAPLQQELDLLFGPLYGEFFIAGSSSVNNSSSPTVNSALQDRQPSPNIHPTSETITPTNVNAKENNDNQAKDAQFQQDEFINPCSTPVRKVSQSSSRNIDNSNMHTFNQPQDSKYRWTKDHLLSQVRRNPSKPVQTRRQLATDPEMCIFALTAKYALEILKKHGMEKGQSIGIPMATKPKLDADLSGKLVDQTDYRSKIGSLMYLTSSRPDIVQAVCYCARTQLKDYGFNCNKIPLYYDSQSAIAISCNPVQHSYTKHIHTRYHFIKEQVKNGIIELYFVRTEYQLADIFTKALLKDRFQYLVGRIGMRCLTLAELEVLTNEFA